MDLSVVIPVYCSSSMVRDVVRACHETLRTTDLTWEIIMVNDGSSDDSWKTLQAVASEYGNVTVIDLMRNYGQHNATVCGLRHASGAYVATIDDDLQTPPSSIVDLYNAARNQSLDLVYGIPASRNHARWRNLGSLTVRKVFRLALNATHDFSSFRMIRRDLLDCILNYKSNFTFIDGYLAWNTNRVGQIPAPHYARKEGKSGYRLRTLIELSMNVFTNFSLLPLRIATISGFVMAFFGLVATLFYLGQYFFHEILVTGYASTIIAILTLSGVQLISLGIVGEYIGRVHVRLNDKPQYSVRQVVRSNSKLEKVSA